MVCSQHVNASPQSVRRPTVSGPPPPMRASSPNIGSSRVLSTNPINTAPGPNPALATGASNGDWISRTQSRDSIASNSSTGSGTGALAMPPPPLTRASGGTGAGPGSALSAGGYLPSGRVSSRSLSATPSPPTAPLSSSTANYSPATAVTRAVAALVPPTNTNAPILKRQGWVLKEDCGPQGKRSWSKKFMCIDFEEAVLLFGPTPASLQNQSSVESILRLTRDMRCARPPNSDEDNCLIEVSDARGLKLRIQLSSSEDQLEWLTTINSLLE